MSTPAPTTRHDDPLVDEVRQIRAKLDAEHGESWPHYAEKIQQLADALRRDAEQADALPPVVTPPSQ
jgi:hypothetical protein